MNRRKAISKRTLGRRTLNYFNLITQAESDISNEPSTSREYADHQDSRASSEMLYSIYSTDVESDNVNAENVDFNSSESSSISSEDANIGLTREVLRNWAITNKITHTAVSGLLRLLRAAGHVNLPLDARTLLETPKFVKTHIVPPGEYWHAGLEKSLKEVVILHSNEIKSNTLHLQISIDGLPISKSSKGQFWPILGKVQNIKPFVVGIYYGPAKPLSAEQFLNYFIEELIYLIANGIEINNTQYIVQLKCFVCDAPARAFIKGIFGHNSTYGCEKCFVEGKFFNKRMFYEHCNATLRTDLNFRNQLQDDHHKHSTPLDRLPIDLIKDIPLDYMHLILLGVQKKIFKFWIHGSANFKTKLRADDISELTANLYSANRTLPSDINRSIRGADVLSFWKATEFRTFLLKAGPVVLHGLLPRPVYYHFLLLHCATTICISDHFLMFVSVAKQMFTEFVMQFSEIYGKEYISYNVHSLLHVTDDVIHLGSFDTYSAFCFENFLGQILTYLRSGKNPLQQAANRIAEELSCLSNNNTNTFPDLGHIQKKDHEHIECKGVYLKLALENMELNVSDRNRWVLLKTKRIIKIINFTLYKNKVVLYASELKNIYDFYEKPIKSSTMYIFSSDLVELKPQIYFVSDILCKMFYIQNPNVKHTFFPLLHTISK